MRSGKAWILVLCALAAPCAPAHAAADSLNEKLWIHGSEDCDTNEDPPIEVYAFDATTYVLRQNKCVHAEAPFIYVLFGAHTVFVQDTGATDEADEFPIYDTVRGLVTERERATGTQLKMLVTHSHSHSDHTAGDDQFKGRKGVKVVKPTSKAVRKRFKFEDWPKGQATLDLGGRVLTVLPLPGHQGEHVAVYDPATGWLLTGDTLYPGRLIVNDWNAYRASIARLAEFSRGQRISALMGTHIEMSAAGELYEPGSTYHPNETALPLPLDDLMLLHAQLQQAGDKPQEIKLDRLVVTPPGWFRRSWGRMLKLVGIR